MEIFALKSHSKIPPPKLGTQSPSMGQPNESLWLSNGRLGAYGFCDPNTDRIATLILYLRVDIKSD